MVFLKYISLSGFKSIKSIRLELRPLNVLIGANGAGKSNLLSLFHLAREMQQGRLQLFVSKEGGADTLLSYGAKTTENIKAKFLFERESQEKWARYFSYSFRLAPTATDSLTLQRENLSFDTSSGHAMCGCGTGGYRESQLLPAIGDWRQDPSEASALAAEAGTTVLEQLRKWGSFHFHDTSSTASIRRRCYLHDNQKLHSDGSNLAPILYKLQKSHATAYHRIIETIRQIAPWFGDFVLQPMKPNETDVLLNWQDRYSDHVFGPHQLPDGALRMMALITLLLQPEEDLPSLIVIDEPELGLHPAAITVFAALLKAASLHSQIIIATQSVTLLEEFEPADVIVVDREHGHSTFTRQDPERLKDWLEDYTLGELWQKNSIGGGPF